MMNSDGATSAMLGAAATLGVTVAVIAQCPPQYQVAAVIDPPTCGIFGPAGISPTSMNAEGQVAGYTQCVSSTKGFVWSGSLGFNSLSPSTGISQVKPYGINNVVGTNGMGQMTGEMTPSGTPARAFLLDDDEWTNLGLLPGSNKSSGHSVNDSTIVVGLSQNNITGPFLAFRWQDGAMEELTGFPHPNSSATDINAAGQITGRTYSHLLQDARAFIWDDGKVQILPPVPGGTTSQGSAINVHGDVAGQGKFFDPEWDANVWRGYAYIDGEAIRIDPLPGYKDSRARSINSSGQIVGNMTTPVAGRAFLWQNGTLYDLNDLVPAGTVHLRNARVIDDAGRIVATTTFDPPHLLTPLPAPTGDLNCDGAVGVDDLLILLSAWGECDDPDDCPADLDGDGAVGVDDLLILLANWG